MSGIKRKRNYYNQMKKKSRYGKLEPGMRGFIVSCNNREKEAIKESYNLLNEYADKLYGTVKIESDDENGDDIEAALKKEVESLKVHKNVFRFTNMKSCVNNCLFISTSCENPNEIVHAIYEDVIKTKVQNSRFILRFVPVLETCSVSVEKIVAIIEEKYDDYFGPSAGGVTFKIQIKIRNNSDIKSAEILDPVVDAILKLCPENTVNLDTPQRTMNIDILQRVCCLGVLFDQVKYAKYNLEAVQANNRPAEEEVAVQVKEVVGPGGDAGDKEADEVKDGGEKEEEEEKSPGGD